MLKAWFGLLLLSVACSAQEENPVHELCLDLQNYTGILGRPAMVCNMYLECDNGRLREKLCAGSSAFNVDQRMCSDFNGPEDDCARPGPIYESGCTPGPVQGQCEMFRECNSAGEEVIKECGIDTVYSELVNVCVHPSDEYAMPECRRGLNEQK